MTKKKTAEANGSEEVEGLNRYYFALEGREVFAKNQAEAVEKLNKMKEQEAGDVNA